MPRDENVSDPATPRDRSALAGWIKPHPEGDPLDRCLRCGDEVGWADGVTLDYQTRGNAGADAPPNVLGYLCVDCLARTLREWGYEPPPEARDGE